MMNCNDCDPGRMPEEKRKFWGRRLTLMASLVLFVFGILLVTMMLAGICFYVVFRWMPAVAVMRFPINILLLLISSIAIGTCLTAAIGKRPLRPFTKLITATQEIAAGNFDVRVDLRGPRELERLGNSFNAMAKELGSIETLRDDFVSNVSHEFKTPVVSIRGFAKLLKKGNLSEERQREYLDIIIKESERLSQLSGNVLLLSKLEQQEAAGDKTTFSLDEQIRRSILVLQPEWHKKKLNMNIELEDTVLCHGNEELIQQIWMNVLGNAIKFTEPDGEITVSLSQQSGAALVVISDNGIGMDEEVSRHLFDKFYQGNKSRATQGNGLGLSLVKRIVDLCGGKIEVASSPGAGSSFHITLPV